MAEKYGLFRTQTKMNLHVDLSLKVITYASLKYPLFLRPIYFRDGVSRLGHKPKICQTVVIYRCSYHFFIADLWGTTLSNSDLDIMNGYTKVKDFSTADENN